MGLFEDIGYIPAKTSLIDKIKILVISYPRIIYGLKAGVSKHKFVNKPIELKGALEELDKELNELISRVSAKDFKSYALHLIENGELPIDDEFWVKYPQVYRYINREQEDEYYRTTLYMDLHSNLNYATQKLNSGIVPIEFIAGNRENLLETAIFDRSAPPELWLKISDSYWKDNQIENAIYAMEEAFWISNGNTRFFLLTQLAERLNNLNIKIDSNLVKFYLKFLNGLSSVQHSPQSTLNDDFYREIYESFVKMPNFRLKTRLILLQIFFEISGDSIEILRKCEDVMHELVLWGAKEIDLAPFVRDTIKIFYSKQEHEGGISIAIDNLNILRKFSLFKENGNISYVLKLELARAYSYFNKNRIASNILESVPLPEIEDLKLNKQTSNIEDQFTTAVRYYANYGILVSQLKNNESFLKKLIEKIGVISEGVTSQDEGVIQQIKAGILTLLGALTEYSDVAEIDNYINQIFEIINKLPLQAQLLVIAEFVFDTKILQGGDLRLKLSTIPSFRSKIFKLSLKLITDSYQEVVAFGKKKLRQIYLSCLLKVFVMTNEDPSKLIDAVKILEDQISNGESFINVNTYLIWIEILRADVNYAVVLDKLIEKTKPSSQETSTYLRICLVQLLAEFKNPKALQLYSEILDEVWNLKDSSRNWEIKYRFLNRLITIIPFFGISTGQNLLEKNYSKLQEQIKDFDAPTFFINEILISISDSVSKLEGDASSSLKLIRDVINLSDTLIKERKQVPSVIFDGLELLSKQLITIPSDPHDLIELYHRLAQMAQNFLQTLKIREDDGRIQTNDFFPIQLLLTISNALEILGENTEEILDVAFKHASSMEESNLNTMLNYALTKVANESGAQRYIIFEKCMKIISSREKQGRHSMQSMNMPINNMMLLNAVTHSEYAIISAIKYHRGLEEGDVRREIVKIFRKIGYQY